jgi:hypothetical protein
MLTVSFAFLVATILFFCFERTRWMGVVAVFVLLCINPFLVVGFVVLLVIAAWLIAANGRDREIRRWLLDRHRRK